MKDDKVIKVFEKSLASYVVNYGAPWVFLVNTKFQLKMFGTKEIIIELPILTDVSVDYIQAYAVTQDQEKYIFQINVCFIISDKSRMFCKYVIENNQVIDKSLTLHTNIRISRTYPSFLRLNALVVTNNLYIAENLRDCKLVHTFNERIEQVYWQQKNFWVVHGKTCEQFDIDNNLLNTIENFDYIKQMLFYKGSLYNLQENCIQRYENQKLVYTKQIYNCIHLLYDTYSLIQVLLNGNCLQFLDFEDTTVIFEFQMQSEYISCNYLQPLQTFIVKTQTYDIIFYIPLIRCQKASYAQLNEGCFSVNSELQLCQIQRTKYGNMETQLEHIICNVPDLSIFFEVTGDFNDEIDINSQFESLNRFSQFFQSALPFLAMNQFNYIEIQTKYNKNDFPEWLQNFYATLDSTNKIPKISIDQLLNSNILYTSPVYHLIDIITQMATGQYQLEKSPQQVSLYFIICNKVQLLANLYKLSNQVKVAEFLKRDFSILSNQQAAIKNAFVLLSKHQYEMSAAWFIIGKDYINAIKILSSVDYFNSAILALRSVQILRFHDQIDDDIKNILLLQIQNCYLSDNLNALDYIEAVKVNQFILINFSNEKINILQILQLLQDLTKHQIKATDIPDLVSFLYAVHLFYQDINISQFILSLSVSLSLRYSSLYIKLLYQKISNQLKIKSIPIYSIIKQKEVLNNEIISFDSISLPVIEQCFDFTVPKIFNQKKYSTLLQFLFVSQPKFRTCQNLKLVQINLRRIFKSKIYEFLQNLQIDFLDILVLLNIIFIVKEIFDEDEHCFYCWQKVADYIGRQQMERNLEIPSVENLNQVFKFARTCLFSEQQEVALLSLIQKADPKDVSYILVVLEEKLIFWHKQVNNQQTQSQISTFLDNYRINKKNATFFVQHYLPKHISGIYVLQSNPTILITQTSINVVTAFIQQSKQFISQEFSADSFEIQHQTLYLISEELITLSYSFQLQKLIETTIKPRYQNSVFCFQEQNHFYIEMSPKYIVFNAINSNLIRKHILQQISKIISICLTKTLFLCIVQKENQDRILLQSRISDIQFTTNIEMKKLLQSNQIEGIYVVMDGNLERFLLIFSSKFVIFDEKFQSISEHPVAVQGGFCVKKEQFCCSDVKLSVFGKGKSDFCVLCGQEFQGNVEEGEGVEIVWE
eukprot:EST46586.1 RAVE protein 1 C terminal domain-containing protein [Spironucleus salmonicida]